MYRSHFKIHVAHFYVLRLLCDRSVHRDPSSTSDSGRLSGPSTRSLAKRYFAGAKRRLAGRPVCSPAGSARSNLYDLRERFAPLTLWLIYACHTRRTLLVAPYCVGAYGERGAVPSSLSHCSYFWRDIRRQPTPAAQGLHTWCSFVCRCLDYFAWVSNILTTPVTAS